MPVAQPGPSLGEDPEVDLCPRPVTDHQQHAPRVAQRGLQPLPDLGRREPRGSRAAGGSRGPCAGAGAAGPARTRRAATPPPGPRRVPGPGPAGSAPLPGPGPPPPARPPRAPRRSRTRLRPPRRRPRAPGPAGRTPPTVTTDPRGSPPRGISSRSTGSTGSIPVLASLAALLTPRLLKLLVAASGLAPLVASGNPGTGDLVLPSSPPGAPRAATVGQPQRPRTAEAAAVISAWFPQACSPSGQLSNIDSLTSSPDRDHADRAPGAAPASGTWPRRPAQGRPSRNLRSECHLACPLSWPVGVTPVRDRQDCDDPGGVIDGVKEHGNHRAGLTGRPRRARLTACPAGAGLRPLGRSGAQTARSRRTTATCQAVAAPQGEGDLYGPIRRYRSVQIRCPAGRDCDFLL